MNDRSILEPAAVQGSVLIAGVGASNGLGAAIARRFAAGGYPVAIAGRNADKLAATAAELAATGAKVAHVVGDASTATDVARFVEVTEQLAPLAMAVHNAGSNRPAPFLKVSAQRFEEHWREHTLGGFQLAQAAIPALLKRGGGTLVFTGASGCCAARPTTRRSPQPRPHSARWRRAWRASSGRRASMSATSSSMAASRVIACSACGRS